MIGNPSRQVILDRLHGRSIASTPSPSADPARLVRYVDPVAKFIEILTWVGGRVHCVNELSEIELALGKLPEFHAAKWIASTIPETVPGNFNLAQIDDPHSLAALDWSIMKGEFCVAENGAIWVPAKNLTERTMLFIAQHLVLVVSKSEIEMHMHDAYRRVDQSDSHQRGLARFGVFVSGPSKTADIEQSLVLGAHGCRTLEVFLTT